MTPIKESAPVFDHSFSVFALGLTLGVVGAMLLGTKEGRKVSREILDTLASSKLAEDIVANSKTVVRNAVDKLEETEVFSPPISPKPQGPLLQPQYFKS